MNEEETARPEVDDAALRIALFKMVHLLVRKLNLNEEDVKMIGSLLSKYDPQFSPEILYQSSVREADIPNIAGKAVQDRSTQLLQQMIEAYFRMKDQDF